MSFEKIPYDNQRVETIRIRLENYARTGNPIAYAITIDKMEIIPRTTDATLFSSIYEVLNENTRSLSISEYVGDTRNRNTTCFVFAATPSSNSTLQGIDFQQQAETFEERVQKQVEQVTLKQSHDKVQRDNQTIKGQLNVLLDKCDKLEEEKGELSEKINELSHEKEELIKLQDENSQTKMLLALGKEALEKWMGIKQAEGPLAGTEQPGTRNAEQGQTSNEGPTHVAVPENEFKDYKFFTTLFQKFDPVERGLVSQLITLLTEHPELIEETFMNAFQKTQNDDTNDNSN